MTRTRRLLCPALVVAATIASLAAEAAGSPATDQSERYRNCVLLVSLRPQEALESALAWAHAGGGYSAHHCLALALQALGEHRSAARGFQKLALDLGESQPAAAAKLFAQAGAAWLEADQPKTARYAFAQALRLDPGNVDALLGRARAYIAAEQLDAALDDLNAVIEIAPDSQPGETARGYLDKLRGGEADK